MALETPPYFQEKFFGKLLSFDKRQWSVSLVAIGAGIALLIAYFHSGPNPVTYLQGEEAYSKWEASPEDESLYAEMRKAFKRAPALEKRFEAPMAQRLIDGERLEEAFPLAESSLKVLRKEAPYHASYGETSLLIEKRSFQEAIERAVSLKEEMLRELDLESLASKNPIGGGVILYAHNLLRIAFLQKELGNCPGEKAAWEELEDFLNKKIPVADLIYANFKERGVDLTSFITARRKEI